MLKSVGQLYSQGLFWRTALCTLFSNGAYMAVQGLWMGPWLRDVGHLPRAEVAQVLFWSTAAMVAGSLSFGALTDWLARHRVRSVTVCGSGVAVFLLVQVLMLWPTGLPLHAPFWLLAVAFSYFGTAGAMNYAILAQGMPAALTGRVSTSFNLLIFLAAFALQWGLGAVINQWTDDHGAYPEAAYQTALAVCLAVQVPGLLLWLGFKPCNWPLLRPPPPPGHESATRSQGVLNDPAHPSALGPHELHQTCAKCVTLQHLGLPFVRTDAGMRLAWSIPPPTGPQPNGLVPTLQDGELVLWESNAIVRYLCARHGETPACTPPTWRYAPMPTAGWTGSKHAEPREWPRICAVGAHARSPAAASGHCPIGGRHRAPVHMA